MPRFLISLSRVVHKAETQSLEVEREALSVEEARAAMLEEIDHDMETGGGIRDESWELLDCDEDDSGPVIDSIEDMEDATVEEYAAGLIRTGSPGFGSKLAAAVERINEMFDEEEAAQVLARLQALADQEAARRRQEEDEFIAAMSRHRNQGVLDTHPSGN